MDNVHIFIKLFKDTYARQNNDTVNYMYISHAYTHDIHTFVCTNEIWAGII